MTPEEQLEDAILWMCTEMPVGWEEVAEEEGRGDVVSIVRKIIEESS